MCIKASMEVESPGGGASQLHKCPLFACSVKTDLDPSDFPSPADMDALSMEGSGDTL